MWYKSTSILHETVLAVAQTEQVAAAEEEENLAVPDEFPQDAAHAHLLLGGQLLTRDDAVFRNHHLVLLEADLDNLIAQVDKSDARGVVTAFHHHQDSVSELLVAVEEMYGIGVVFHGAYVLVDDANIGFLSKQTNFSHLIINRRAIFVSLQSN